MTSRSIDRDAPFWMEAGERVEPDVFAAAVASWEWALEYSERLLRDISETAEMLGTSRQAAESRCRYPLSSFRIVSENNNSPPMALSEAADQAIRPGWRWRAPEPPAGRGSPRSAVASAPQ